MGKIKAARQGLGAILSSNEPINPINRTMAWVRKAADGRIAMSKAIKEDLGYEKVGSSKTKISKDGKELEYSRKTGYGDKMSDWDRAKAMLKDKDTGKLSMKRAAVAGLATYAVPATAGRLASGGGIYKDSHGNTDIMGIPFI